MTPATPLRIDETRFSRQELISWWDQRVLQSARVLVVGAGALGNEILKNLALLGVGNVFLVDFDTIEFSNLSRTVLFRESDLGQRKVDAAARAVRDLYPAAKIRPFHGNVVYDLGLGVFRWAQIVLGGLDNREARLEVNRACWKTGTPWIDGAIEALDGQMRLFVPPDGPCYECTMSAVDWKLLEARRSCTLLSRGEMLAGKVPTVATVSSVIAALQCQEAVKWLHGITDMSGQGIVFNGRQNDFYRVTYQRKEECYSHETLGGLVPLSAGVADLRAGDLLELARARLGRGAIVELNQEVLRELECPQCHGREEVLASLGRISEDATRCPKCNVLRIPHTLHELDDACGLLDRTPAEIGVPPYDILTARCPDGDAQEKLALFFDRDAAAVLGDLTHDA
jgi:molybdopterin/thiamine biosynthesis adenylyltransferase